MRAYSMKARRLRSTLFDETGSGGARVRTGWIKLGEFTAASGKEMRAELLKLKAGGWDWLPIRPPIRPSHDIVAARLLPRDCS